MYFRNLVNVDDILGDQCLINRDFALGILNPLNPKDQFAAF